MVKITFQWISDHLTALVALAVFISSRLNSKKLTNLHGDLNSRLTELLNARGASERSKGVQEGRELSITEAQARTDEAERVTDREKG